MLQIAEGRVVSGFRYVCSTLPGRAGKEEYMSVNYHASQSRGVLFSEYETVCQQWRDEFSGFDPERIRKILHLDADPDYLYLTYYKVPYRLRLEDGILEKQEGDGWTQKLYFNESMAVYHLLHFTKDLPVISGKWVPGHTIDGVVSRNPAVKDPLLSPFEKRCGGRTEALRAACLAAGGEAVQAGDAAYEFEAFPQVHLRLVFWDQDEDFPAQVQILVDQCVTDFVHYETVGCMIADLLDQLDV